MITNAYKTVNNGRELLEFLQSLSPEELELPLARTDLGPEYGPFYDQVSEVSISEVSTAGGWSAQRHWHIVF